MKHINNITLLGITLLFLVLHVSYPSPAAARLIYRTSSSIVVDAESNRVIYEDNADALAYPASLTKTMTLLLLFDELRSERWQPNSLLNVSANAARKPKTRLGLRAGDQISVDLAIRSIVVLSANDAAVAVGENIAGSEGAFAARMNKRAKEIGMNQTRFANSSGLPDKSQITTARDIATLGLYILNNYPQYYHYFSLDKFLFRNVTIRTHNRLIEHFEGADGFKTGYIARSGYNLLTSAERNGKRVVAVVLGGGTASDRDGIMSFLLDRYIPYADTYTKSFDLGAFKVANATPQGSLKDAYKRFVRPVETAQEAKLRMRKAAIQQRAMAEAKKRAELHSQLLIAGKKPSSPPAVEQIRTALNSDASNGSIKNKKAARSVKIASNKKIKKSAGRRKDPARRLSKANQSSTKDIAFIQRANARDINKLEN